MQNRTIHAYSWRKDGLLCIAWVASVLILTTFAFYRHSSDRLSHYFITEAELRQIMAQHQPTEDNLLSSLSIAGEKLAFDHMTDTFLFSVKNYDDIRNLSFSWEGLDEQTQIALLPPATDAVSLRDSFSNTIIVYTQDCYRLYNLTLTSLPLIVLTTANIPDDPQEPLADQNEPGAFQLYDPSTSDPAMHQINCDVVMHVRGGSSRSYPQKQIHLALKASDEDGTQYNKKVSLLGMRKDDDWLLISTYNDPSNLRQCLSTNLWWEAGASSNSFGLKIGTPAKFVEVFLNGRYWGLYLLMQPVDAKQLSLNNAETDTTTEYLYRSISYAETTAEMFEQGGAEKIVGGYELKFPKGELNTKEKWKPLNGYLDILFNQRENFDQAYPAAVDLDNAIDVWLMTQITEAVDNDSKNLNIVAKERDRRYIILFGLWDLDETWGNIWTEGSQNLTQIYPDATSLWISSKMTGIDSALSFQLDGLGQRVVNRYSMLRSTVCSDQYLSMRLQQYEAQVYDSGAAIRTHERWPDSNYESEVSELRDYVQARLTYLDATLPQSILKQ